MSLSLQCFFVDHNDNGKAGDEFLSSLLGKIIKKKQVVIQSSMGGRGGIKKPEQKKNKKQRNRRRTMKSRESTTPLSFNRF